MGQYGFAVEPRYWSYGWTTSKKIKGRLSTVKALKRAQKLLPKGYNFLIWDCQRPYNVQAMMMKDFNKRLKVLYPKLSLTHRKKLLLKFSGGLVKHITRLDTHRRGGAVDLTIIDTTGKELDMGTDHDDLTKKASTDYYEQKANLTAREKRIKKNRRLLVKAMKQTGFKGYILEWWHWSYSK